MVYTNLLLPRYSNCHIYLGMPLEVDLVARRKSIVRDCALSAFLFVIVVLIFIMAVIALVRERPLTPRCAFESICQRVFRCGTAISDLSGAGAEGQRKVPAERIRVERGVFANDLTSQETVGMY